MKNKILILSLAYYPHVGGAEVAWKEITDRIGGYEFDIVVAKMQKGLSNYEKIGNINVHRIGIGNSIVDKLIYVLYAPFKGYLLNKKRNYSIVVGLMASFGGLASIFLKNILKTPIYLLNLQDGDTDEYIESKTKYIGGLYSKIFSNHDIVTVLAKFLGSRARENNFNGEIILIPNGVDISKFLNYKNDDLIKNNLRQKIGINTEDKVIVTTSRLNYKNAIDDIILSLTFLPDNYKFLCLGDGEDRPKLEELIKKNNLEKRVFLVGFVAHKEMLDYLSISNYFCRPSLQEGLGNSFLEAMAFKLPVIATPVGGILDFLIDGETGYFCKVKNPKSISDSVMKFNNDEDKTNIIKLNALKMVKEKYNWDKVGSDYKNLFDRLIKGKY